MLGVWRTAPQRTNNLGILAVAWIATSLALHGLLTLFRHRPQALIAAQKKFLASRLGDLFMLAGVVCIGWSYRTLEIDRAVAVAQNLFAQVNLGAQLPDLAMAAALCLAVSALLKCAQPPVLGWLI
ncbi:proton-conducting transporter membrane subunit [Variovorax sp. H27-G14]|uniref:proton-conducting transporter transmembrane domain-containing protein n=1 Tax=Variovorax sp. H27-G14 TaxID=3111914 RepID=UPI0038FD0F9B